MPLADDLPTPSRRTFLLGTAVTATAGLVFPSAYTAASAGTADSAVEDPDRLFWRGEFDNAARGYRRLLRKDPENAHATAQLGYIALLSNRFATAERYLSTAATLEPGDVASLRRLAECYVRQDEHARAAALLNKTGDSRDAAHATVYAHFTGKPWRIGGASSTRVPFLFLDPLPTIEASVNGRQGRFVLDTGATVSLTQEIAEEAGLRSLATVTGVIGGQEITIHLGILESLRIGGIEVRDLPVQWHQESGIALPDGSHPAGVLGTTLFYHFLSTMDYAGQALVLRRKSAAPERAAARVPLWLAGDHLPCTLGSMGDYGPRVVVLDTGAVGAGINTTVEYAERAGLTVDYEHPNEVNGTVLYPIKADRLSLGRAVGRDVPGDAAEKAFPGYPGPGLADQFGFEPIANFTHEFFKPFAVTFDFSGMNIVITRG